MEDPNEIIFNEVDAVELEELTEREIEMRERSDADDLNNQLSDDELAFN